MKSNSSARVEADLGLQTLAAQLVRVALKLAITTVTGVKRQAGAGYDVSEVAAGWKGYGITMK